MLATRYFTVLRSLLLLLPSYITQPSPPSCWVELDLTAALRHPSPFLLSLSLSDLYTATAFTRSPYVELFCFTSRLAAILASNNNISPS